MNQRGAPSPAELITHVSPGTVVHHTSFALHQMTVTQPSGARLAWWSALWTWTSNDQRELPACAHVPFASHLDIRDVQPAMMFDPMITTHARLPWAHGQPPPPALLPSHQRPALPWWRRLGGPRP